MLRPPPHAKTPARGGKGFAAKRSGPKIRFFDCRARNVPHKFVFLRNEYPLKTKPDMDETIKLHDRQFKVLIPAARIDEAVTDVARRINSDYAARETPLFLGVLNGSFMFLSDLMKKIEFNCELSFVKLASYEGTGSTGEVKNLIGLNNDLAGRHVVIVEDIVDTGGSIEHMVRELERHRPASIEICTLFFKPASYARTIPVRYRALEIGNEFIVGYGLDYNQLGRNLKDVYVVTE
jgi:hypoxanthine phosphoribosyltransferase